MAYRSDLADLIFTDDGAQVFAPFVENTTFLHANTGSWTSGDPPTFDLDGIGVAPNEDWARWDGTNYGFISGASALQATSITVEAWIWLDSSWSTTGYIASRYRNDLSFSDNAFEFYVLSDRGLRGRVFVGNDGTRIIASTNVIPTETWTHVAFSYTSGELRIYVNGQLDDTESVTAGNINLAARSISFGGRHQTSSDTNFTSFFKGGIAYFAYFKSRLTNAQIESHYDQMFVGSATPTATAALGAVTATATVSVSIESTAAVGLGGVTVTASNPTVTISPTATVLLGAVSATAAATLDAPPRALVNLGSVTATAAASVTARLSAAAVLGPVTAAAVPSVAITATAAVSLGAVSATAARFLPPFVQNGFVVTTPFTAKTLTRGEDPTVIEVTSNPLSAVITMRPSEVVFVEDSVQVRVVPD